MAPQPPDSFFFFFNDTATTEIYTLSLHDALPILPSALWKRATSSFHGSGTESFHAGVPRAMFSAQSKRSDRKSTRLNSSHSQISYAVFCLKKKKDTREPSTPSASAWTTLHTPQSC